jgi:hypothetical protein
MRHRRVTPRRADGKRRPHGVFRLAAQRPRGDLPDLGEERPHEDQIMGLIRTAPIPENPSGTLVLGAIWSWIWDRLDAIYKGRW